MSFQDISILIPAKASAEFIIPKIKELQSYFHKNWNGQFEIIISLNGDEKEIVSCFDLINQTFPGDKTVIAHKHYFPKGKGAALQSAFSLAQYDLVSFIDSDLPFDLKFFLEAKKCINDGSELVAGNRRLPESVFSIPVPLLSFVYRRHLSGLLYNWLVRMLFGITVRDTQCGIKMMTKGFAHQFFWFIELLWFFL